jgi:UDP-N-acetylmuramate--alanine ligase
MKKIHFVGVGGAGTSAAAALAKESGFQVSGCDTDKDSIYLSELEKLDMEIEGSHGSEHLKDLDILVASAAIDKFDSKNPEVLEAKKKGLKVLKTEKFVAEYLAKERFLIAIAGTHGKSTTTAMVGVILEDAGLDPTVYVGTIVTKWGRNYRHGKSRYFVVEADEYEDKFLNYHPNIGVINNIEYDHPDYFESEDQLVKSFVNFVENFEKESRLILGTDPEESKNIQKLVKDTESVASIMKDDNWYMKNFGVDMKIFGKHNILNAQAAYLCAKAVGVDEDQIKRSLHNFSGTSRRFEFKGEVNGIKIFDDYAHHPAEVAATLTAAREKFPNERLWCVFQPHTFSRTEALFDDFVKSFEESSVDKLVIVDIYAAREQPKNISSLDMAKKIRGKAAVYIGEIEEAATYVAKNASSGDIIIAMGAGDIYKLSQMLLNKLKGQNGRKRFS